MKTLFSVLLIVASAFVASCLDDAEAQSGVSRAEFNALLDRVTALEANAPGDKAYSADAAGLAKAATPEGKALGTALGFSGGLPDSSNEMGLRSATGYLYTVNVGSGEKTGPKNHEIFYESADCSGQGYMTGISDYAARQGYVFAITANGGTTWDNPSQFYYVPAGSVRVADIPVNVQSRRAAIEAFCFSANDTENIAFPVLANDPAITGVDSGSISLPITIQ